jgi:hypothetical protein
MMNVIIKGKENGSIGFHSSSISHQLITNLLNCVDGQAICYMHCSNIDIMWAPMKLSKFIAHLLHVQSNIVCHWIIVIASIHFYSNHSKIEILLVVWHMCCSISCHVWWSFGSRQIHLGMRWLAMDVMTLTNQHLKKQIKLYNHGSTCIH